MSLEEFAAQDDRVLYGDRALEAVVVDSLMPPVRANTTPRPSPPSTPHKRLELREAIDPLAPLLPLATVTLHNPFDTFEPFFRSLSLETLANAMRPSWDAYFMLLASLASMRSNCMKRRVGAVLVRDKRVVSTGYNGTPRGVKNCAEGGCTRCNSHSDGFFLPVAGGTANDEARQTRDQYAMGQGLDECVCLHAEENALLEAGRERVSGGGTTGAVLYCNTCVRFQISLVPKYMLLKEGEQNRCPCLRCTVKIVQCGVTEVVYSLSYSMDDASRSVLTEAGIGLRQIEMPPFP